MGFTGCFALTCVRAACGCAFCAYCFEDCGNDAHAHVRARRCSPNNEGLFPQPAAEKFAHAHRLRREKMLREFLVDMEEGERHQLVVELARELRDLGLQPESFL